METNDSYKCPNCYNRVYKGQIICIKCGLQLRKGVGDPKSFFQVLVRFMMYIGLGVLIFAIIVWIVMSI